MPKRLFLLCLLLGAACMLCGCRHVHGGIATPAPGMPKDQRLSYLYFSESSSYFKRVQGYELRAQDGRYTAYFNMANEEEPYPVKVDQTWVDTLEGFITAYDMTKWDGFSGSAAGLLDGTQFFVEFAFDDGTQVKAGGYGVFPNGYGEASAAIEAHFLQLLPEDMRDW